MKTIRHILVGEGWEGRAGKGGREWKEGEDRREGRGREIEGEGSIDVEPGVGWAGIPDPCYSLQGPAPTTKTESDQQVACGQLLSRESEYLASIQAAQEATNAHKT